MNCSRMNIGLQIIFLLIKKNGRWWIVAVTNELPTPERPIPPELKK